MGRKTESEIRDLIVKLRAVALDHLAYSQVYGVLQNAFDHMAAIARIEEMNQDGTPSDHGTTPPFPPQAGG